MHQHRQFTITTPDGSGLFVQEWTPEIKPGAVILYVHGLGSHGGRLDHWAGRFNDQQVAFVAYDQRGHGKSDGRRGHPKHVRHLIDDVQILVDLVRNKFPEIPMILYGHSMGGVIALNYVIGSKDQVDGLIASSPWIRLVHPPPKILISLVTPLKAIAPGMTLSNGLNAADISRDKTEVDKYKNDPLVHDRISVGLFLSIDQAGLHALNHAHEINCPFLIMHGTGDRITSHEASKKSVAESGNNTTLKLWENGFHELHHEPSRDELFNYIIKWLKQQKLL